MATICTLSFHACPPAYSQAATAPKQRCCGRPFEVGAGELSDGSAEVVRHDGEREPGGVGHEPARREGFDPAYGARPLRRLVQREIGDRLARMLLAGEVGTGSTVLVDRGDEGAGWS